MRITRRHILALGGGSLAPRMLAATFAVGRLLGVDSAGHADGATAEIRRYSVNATITLFSVPLFSKGEVGGGYAIAEESDTLSGRVLSIQFGAGSCPERARGLNRLGYIHEAITEERVGVPSEFAWLAFMTTSKENNLDQAKKALEASGAAIPYTASQGHGSRGAFTSRVERLEFPSRYTWRDIAWIEEKARAAMAEGAGEAETGVPDRPATFLYLLRRALADSERRTTSRVIFNGRLFQMDTNKERDESATAHFAGLKKIGPSGYVMRLDAVLTEKSNGFRTPFKVWYEPDSANSLPLRFEYQAKSFLRLTFEVGGAESGPPVRFAFQQTKENS